MSINIQFPLNTDPIDYLASFAPAFSQVKEMQDALLGVQDSLRQGRLVLLEPIGMLACLTAEEEAAAFLYYALRSKGYLVPDYGKLHRHHDKAKVVVLALAIYKYFFEKSFEPETTIRVEAIEGRPKITRRIILDKWLIVQDEPLSTITADREGEDGHGSAIERAVNELFLEIVPKEHSIKSYLKYAANRRNLCLYGNPEVKPHLQGEEEFIQYKFNCIAMIVFGSMVFNSDERTSSMNKLVEKIYRKISS